MGTHHVGIVVDVAEGTDACSDTLLATMNTIASTTPLGGYCGAQWAGWNSLAFAGMLPKPLILIQIQVLVTCMHSKQ